MLGASETSVVASSMYNVNVVVEKLLRERN